MQQDSKFYLHSYKCQYIKKRDCLVRNETKTPIYYYFCNEMNNQGQCLYLLWIMLYVTFYWLLLLYLFIWLHFIFAKHRIWQKHAYFPAWKNKIQQKHSEDLHGTISKYAKFLSKKKIQQTKGNVYMSLIHATDISVFALLT